MVLLRCDSNNNTPPLDNAAYLKFEKKKEVSIKKKKNKEYNSKSND